MSRKPLFALVDCNNFFVSCERIFRPDLEDKPVVVLSSNDGCFVARSNEAKALGLPMGAPAFKYREIMDRHNVVCFSANFELYGDISRRITNLLSEVCPRIEVYSIDESFLDISALDIPDVEAWGRELRARVLREISVPVSIGIAPTKTLAKLASEHAKTTPELAGALTIDSNDTLYRAKTPVEAIWGVGWRLAPKLKAAGIMNAHDVAKARPNLIKQLVGSIHGSQLVMELSGQSCLPLEREAQVQQSIMRGRTLGHDTSSEADLEAALASLTARAAFRLREQRQVTHRIGFTLETSRHKPGYQRIHREIKLPAPTNDTGEILALLSHELASIMSPGKQYHRLNIHLLALRGQDTIQSDILGNFDDQKFIRQSARMEALDELNSKFGRGTLRYASENLSNAWLPLRGQGSPRYVSSWSELPTIRCYTAQGKN